MSPGAVLLAGMIILVGSALQASTGLGLAQVAAPLLALIDTRLVPVAVVMVGLGLLVLISARERRALNLAGVGWSVLGCVPGTILGALVIAAVSGDSLAIVCGAVILVAVVLSVIGWAPVPSVPALLGAGFASGLMGTTTATAGPPMGLVYQRSSGAELRATLSAFFIVGNLLSLSALGVAGQIQRFQLEASAWLLPFMLLGFLVSGPARHIVDRGGTRTAVLALSAAAAVALLTRPLW